MQARVMRIRASVGSTNLASGTSSMRTSPALCMTVALMNSSFSDRWLGRDRFPRLLRRDLRPPGTSSTRQDRDPHLCDDQHHASPECGYQSRLRREIAIGALVYADLDALLLASTSSPPPPSGGITRGGR